MKRTAVLALLLTACGTTPPTTATAPTVIPPSGGAAPKEAVVEQARQAPTRSMVAIDLNGMIAGRIELGRLRSEPWRELVRDYLFNEITPLAMVANECKIDTSIAVERAAFSVTSVPQDDTPLVAIEMARPDRGLDCLRSFALSSEAKNTALTTPGGLAVTAVGPFGTAIVAHDLLLIGRLVDLDAAMERLEQGAAEGALLEPVIGPPSTVFTFVTDGLPEVGQLSVAIGFREGRVSIGATIASASDPPGEIADSLRRSLSRGAHRVAGYLDEERARDLIGDAEAFTMDLDDNILRIEGSLRVPWRDTASAEATRHRMADRAKTSELLHTVGAISRGATAAFERERGSVTPPRHELCGSAIDVPSFVPKGTTYQPVGENGKDFETGDHAKGWRCLKFGMSLPHRSQLSYRRGKNYKGPARGCPDPGPNGYEASAEADFDGDGKTTLVTRVATVEKNGKLGPASELCVIPE